MAEAVLSNFELNKFEAEIERINACVELLDPSNSSHSESLLYYDLILEKYLTILKKSYKQARIKESGLRVLS